MPIDPSQTIYLAGYCPNHREGRVSGYFWSRDFQAARAALQKEIEAETRDGEGPQLDFILRSAVVPGDWTDSQIADYLDDALEIRSTPDAGVELRRYLEAETSAADASGGSHGA